MKVKINLGQFKEAMGEQREKYSAAARPAAQAGAQVIYDLARSKVPVSSKGHYFHGKSFKVNGTKYYFAAGSLKSSIYQVFSKDNSSATKATYHVSWNQTKAPYAWMVEFGTSRAPAHPFMGPAILEGQAKAVQAMRDEFVRLVS